MTERRNEMKAIIELLREIIRLLKDIEYFVRTKRWK